MQRGVNDRTSHGNREDLTGEHTVGDAGQAILACLFFIIWIADSFFFHYTTMLNQYVTVYIRIPLGIIFILISGYLALRGMSIVFGEKREPPVVIRKSVFGIVRHPIYLSEILLYLGLIILSISIAAIGLWIIAIVFLHYISRHEEKLLIARFGDEYKQYIRDVPMWIPHLQRK